MMRAFLCILFILVFYQVIVFASSPSILTSADDTLKGGNGHPVLHVVGAQVYSGDMMLTKEGVLIVLSDYPDIASLYMKGKKFRGISTGLALGSIPVMIGGVVLAVNGIDSNSSTGYYDDQEVNLGTNYFVGVAIASIGALMIDGSIACGIIGKILIRNSVKRYNATDLSFHKPDAPGIGYQLGLLDNGNIGLRLTFP